MREVKAKAVGRHERTGLVHVLAEDLAKRPVEDVRGRVIASDALAPIHVDRRVNLVAYCNRTALKRSRVRDERRTSGCACR